MSEALPTALRERLLAARLFLVTALAAIIAAGLISAMTAHAGSRALMWMVAYLVLVAGIAQGVLGLGQALLPARPPAPRWRIGQWLALNAGSASVIAGRLLELHWLIGFGTALVMLALAGFLVAVRRHGSGWVSWLFRGVLWITLLGACTGLVFSLTGAIR